MTDTDFARNAEAIGQLDFVDTVIFPKNVPLVFVELSPRLVAILPTEYHSLQILRESLTIDNVLARYERYIEKLKRYGFDEAAEVAVQMLKTAKLQVRKAH